jgi:(p)ppGpp synthase/HD superfamily hydrolase
MDEVVASHHRGQTDPYLYRFRKQTRPDPMIRIPELMIERVRDFAVLRHADQHFGRHPYSAHLEQVYLLARDHGLSVEEQAAAWGHDLIEDTGCSREELASNFGDAVAHLIWVVSGVGNNRKERNASIYAKLDAHPEGVDLKLCDRLANVSSCIRQLRSDKLRMYREEHPEFLQHVQGGNQLLLHQIDKYLRMTEELADLSHFNSPGAYSLAR